MEDIVQTTLVVFPPGLLLFCVVLARGCRNRESSQTLFRLPLSKICRYITILDWLRLVCFILTGLAYAVMIWYEKSHWPASTPKGNWQLDSIYNLVLNGVLAWIIIGCICLVREISTFSKEWRWLRIFTLLSFIAQILSLWNVWQKEKDKQNDLHANFLVIEAVVYSSLKFVCMFLMLCFNRDWRAMRNAYLSQRGIAQNGDSSLLYSPLINHVEAEGIHSTQSMHTDQEHKKNSLQRTPEQYAGLLSRLTFSWLDPLMRKGSKSLFSMDDFYLLLKSDDPHLISKNFSRAFKAQINSNNDEQESIQLADSIVTDAMRSNSIVSTGDDVYMRLDDSHSEALLDEEKKPVAKTKTGIWTIVKALHHGGVLTEFYKAAFFKIVYDTLMFVGPQILRRLTVYLASDDEPKSTGLTLVATMMLCSVLQTFVLHLYFHKAFRTGMRVRSALLTSIYKKSLRLSLTARQTHSSGEMVNLMSSDCERLNFMFPYLHIAWSAPYQVILSMYFLWSELKYAVLVSLAFVFLFLMPLSVLMTAKSKLIQQALMKVKDDRVRATTEVISSMKVIKMYGWIRNFRSKVDSVREKELIRLRQYVIWRAFSRTLWGIGPVLITLVTFAAFIAFGGVLDPATAFTSLALLNILRFPLAMFPAVLNAVMEAAVSLRRISDFLQAEELDTRKLKQTRRSFENSMGYAVYVSNGNFFWDDALEHQALHNIDIKLEHGTFTVVTGEVGSGKTALLSMLIGDLVPGKISPDASVSERPCMFVGGSIAYAAQNPWIQNATLRDNILFGQPYDQEWYNRVIFCCSLDPDLKQLANGDQTEIGERGINLSGGQKARIALARAVYSQADILLLESCLEAVDEHVSAFLSEHCFDGVLKEPNPKTGRVRSVIIVTHALQHVRNADRVIVMKNGCIVEQGLFSDISSKKDSEFQRLAQTQGMFSVQKSDTGDTEVLEAIPVAENKQQIQSGVTNTDKDGKLVGEEIMAIGSVDRAVYKAYFKAVGGVGTVLLILIGLGIRTAFDSGTSAWLAEWSKHEKHTSTQTWASNDTFVFQQSMSDTSLSSHTWLDIQPISAVSTQIYESNGSNSTGFYLGVYAGMTLGNLLFVCCLTLYYALVSLRASRLLHKNMLHSVVRAPMSFFDQTPLGRIINRFTKDVYCVDEQVPDSMYSFLSTVFSVLGVVVTISAIVPAFLLIIPFLMVMYMYIQRYYISSSRQMKRWDSVLRSPIFSHFSESLEGVSTIRAYGSIPQFLNRNMEMLETQLAPFYVSISANRWLAVRLESIGSLLVLFTNLLVVLFLKQSNASFGALAISNALTITQTLNWTVRMSSEIETNIVSIERINEYIDEKSEAPEDDPDASKVPGPHEQWPSNGCIEFKNVYARYRPELEDVLVDVSFFVGGGEKIGVVGRTGSGKSSLFVVFLRIIECRSGCVTLDGYNLRDFGLERLRSSIAIIPQDPVLFSASIRTNIDPLGEFSDSEIWDALEHAHLKEYIQTLGSTASNNTETCIAPDPLDYELNEGGSNLSFGQRQLLCIARALLRRCRVVLLDEATSGIDSATDGLIQSTIATQFANVTMLTIAHRLNTITDSDKILVMDEGKAVEFDSPGRLLENPNSFFSLLVQQMQRREDS